VIRIWKLKIHAAVASCFLLDACGSAPPPSPAVVDSLEDRRAAWEQRVQYAAKMAYLAGEDGGAVYARAYLQGCLYDAQHITDASQRSAAIKQCRIDWPQPVQQQAPITTNCVDYGGGQIVCTSQ
jgi:hypothetical protein